mgnify:CR=1 FL=1
MMEIFVSIVYVVFIIGISSTIYNKVKCKFLIRKIIHMGMAGWWFIRLQYLDSKVLWLGPAFFIIINFVLSQKMECEKGIVYFPLSLTGLTLLSMMSDTYVFPATAAVMVLGYADPIAALVGRKRQLKQNLRYEKSLLGSMAFEGVAFIILLIVCRVYCIHISIFSMVIISVLTAFAEAKIFSRFDNIVVPTVVFVSLHIICREY